jgi:hypothetical protein
MSSKRLSADRMLSDAARTFGPEVTDRPAGVEANGEAQHRPDGVQVSETSGPLDTDDDSGNGRDDGGGS